MQCTMTEKYSHKMHDDKQEYVYSQTSEERTQCLFGGCSAIGGFHFCLLFRP